MRGDHGTENVLVASRMEELRGLGRGSYIWGRYEGSRIWWRCLFTQLFRSVHNTRIERLWYDVTHGFGQKWKRFFLELEANHGLDTNLPAHIWLLHHLFLTRINEDADEWAHAWNSHTLQLRGERNSSPRDIFFFSMHVDGPRGIPLPAANRTEDVVDDIEMYGVDWEAAEDPSLMNHLRDNNPQDWDSNNPFNVAPPASLSNVPCEPPNCPFTPFQVQILDTTLRQRVNIESRSMIVRRAVWQVALEVCNEIYIAST